MKKTELVFVPCPGIGHLGSAVEMAKLLTNRDDRISITVLIMKLPTDSKISSYTQSDPTSRIRFIDLPNDDSISPENPNFIITLIESHKPHVREIAAEIARSESARFAGFVLDMFCSSMIDVANEFGVPSYFFFTSGASFLGLMFHLQSLQDDHKQEITEFKDSDTELSVPSFCNPVPARVLPGVALDKEGGGSARFLGLIRKFREVRGIIINSFIELESYAIDSFSNGLYPPIYPVGPILNLNGTSFGGTTDKSHQAESIVRWLDDQPVESVVFLCFGSMGSFGEDQVREIAIALERSGSRFLWSLRQPPPKGRFEFPGEYTDVEEVLPNGFLERTVEMGKVIGWAPQVTILSHPSVGGFVSHCGWNSTLESIWSGVPIATWPMYAEQQSNAFELVKELELAVEIRLDYRKDSRSDGQQLVSSDEIESGIRKLMVERSDLREKVKGMREKSRATVVEGGSSYISIGRFIEGVIENA